MLVHRFYGSIKKGLYEQLDHLLSQFENLKNVQFSKERIYVFVFYYMYVHLHHIYKNTQIDI